VKQDNGYPLSSLTYLWPIFIYSKHLWVTLVSQQTFTLRIVNLRGSVLVILAFCIRYIKVHKCLYFADQIDENKDWVFINYTYKRFEGLTQRGSVLSQWWRKDIINISLVFQLVYLYLLVAIWTWWRLLISIY